MNFKRRFDITLASLSAEEIVKDFETMGSEVEPLEKHMETINLLEDHPASIFLFRCLVNAKTEENDIVDEIWKKSGKKVDCTLTMNGVNVSIKPFFESLYKLFNEAVEIESKNKLDALISGTDFLNKFQEIQEEALGKLHEASQHMHQRVNKELGIKFFD